MQTPHLNAFGVSSEPFLTIKEAADALNIPASTLRRAINSEKIPAHRPFSNRIRLRLSEVNAAIYDLQNGGGDE